MDLSVKNKPLNIRTPPLERSPPPEFLYPIQGRPHYDMIHPAHPYILSPTSARIPYHPYYHMTQNFAPMPLPIDTHMEFSERIPYHHDSEDTRSNSSSTHESDHLPDSSTKSYDSEKDVNCNRLSPKSLLKPSSRPFKVINPLGLTLNSFGVNNDSIEAYEEFRKKMLSQVQNSSCTNKNMRRTIHSENPKYSDPNYLEKRQRNNEAAKRSRDARRAKEDEIAIRCAFLEQENIKLKIQLANIEKQKKMLLGLTGHQ